MKRLIAFSFSLSLFFPNSAYASVRTIFATQAQGIKGSIVTLEVAPGYGLNINLLATGEVVKKIWLDDPSRIALSFDSELCQPLDEQQDCYNQGATVVHLRQIQPIYFPNLPHSKDGTTLLTLVAEGAAGRKLYQFKVKPISGEAKYTSITISPDPKKLTPPAEQVLNSTSSPKQLPSTAPTPASVAIDDIRAIRAGLIVAKNRKQINYGTTQWNQAQSAILWLSRGKSRKESALRSGLSLPALNQLIQLGQQPL